MPGINENQLPLTVGILIFDQVEVLDVAGPFEVLAVTRLNEERGQYFELKDNSKFIERV